MSDDIQEPDSPTEELSEGRGTQQFVTFLIGDEAFAVDIAPVQEIIRVPDVVRVPLAPASLDGLSNLRGRVLPIISLRRIFAFEERTRDDSTRAVVVDVGTPLGFVVDRVASVIDVEPSSIEPVENIQSTIQSDLLTGVLRDVSGFNMVMVLDFITLIEREFAEIKAISGSVAAHAMTAAAVVADEDEASSDEMQLVSFSVAEQEYAIEISGVQEIVQVPDTIVSVPNSDTHVLGLMTLRERLLPLVSLRSLFSLPSTDLNERSRVVVVSLGAAAVGIVTDSVSEVLRVPTSVIEEMPALLARDPSMSDISQICRLEQGNRLVSIISVESMFQHSVVRGALQTVESMNTQQHDLERDEQVMEDDEQVVVFQLAGGEFGVPIESVQEIVRVPEQLTNVPKSPIFVEGVINLRGSVLPVVDQRKRLELEPTERNDRQRIMVILLNGVRTGFIVDAVSEVMRLNKQVIEQAPKLSGEQARLIERVANLEGEGRMIQLINPDQLIDERGTAELRAMDDIAA